MGIAGVFPEKEGFVNELLGDGPRVLLAHVASMRRENPHQLIYKSFLLREYCAHSVSGGGFVREVGGIRLPATRNFLSSWALP